MVVILCCSISSLDFWINSWDSFCESFFAFSIISDASCLAFSIISFFSFSTEQKVSSLNWVASSLILFASLSAFSIISDASCLARFIIKASSFLLASISSCEGDFFFTFFSFPTSTRKSDSSKLMLFNFNLLN